MWCLTMNYDVRKSIPYVIELKDNNVLGGLIVHYSL